jgi:hypothetical protein
MFDGSGLSTYVVCETEEDIRRALDAIVVGDSDDELGTAGRGSAWRLRLVSERAAVSPVLAPLHG